MDDVTNRILDQTLLGEAVLTAPAAVLVSDDDENYVAVNDAAESLLGYTRAEFRALRAREVSARPAEDVVRLIGELSRAGSLEGTARLRRKDGVVVEIDYRGFASTVGGLPVIVTVTAPIDTARIV